MPLNIPGLLVPFHLLFNPRLVIPGIVVKDIRQLDFPALYKAGYRGAVFDKDNCLTIPYRDTLVPDLQEAWKSCRETFGEGNVLIVSNSAGTRSDAGEIQAESVTHHLGVPVLRHSEQKPSYSCIASIRNYFSSLRIPVQDEELIVVGDRIFTDVVMANRMKKKVQHQSGPDDPSEKNPLIRRPELNLTGPLSIYTTGVWQKESMVMRWFEERLVESVDKWTKSVDTGNGLTSHPSEGFIKEQDIGPSVTTKKSFWDRFRRG